MIDVENDPTFQLYCGKGFFIVRVVDRKNTNPPIDPVPSNNVKAVPMTLKCPNGELSQSFITLSAISFGNRIRTGTNIGSDMKKCEYWDRTISVQMCIVPVLGPIVTLNMKILKWVNRAFL